VSIDGFPCPATKRESRVEIRTTKRTDNAGKIGGLLVRNEQIKKQSVSCFVRRSGRGKPILFVVR
jgi:hypothetical protein